MKYFSYLIVILMLLETASANPSNEPRPLSEDVSKVLDVVLDDRISSVVAQYRNLTNSNWSGGILALSSEGQQIIFSGECLLGGDVVTGNATLIINVKKAEFTGEGFFIRPSITAKLNTTQDCRN